MKVVSQVHMHICPKEMRLKKIKKTVTSHNHCALYSILCDKTDIAKIQDTRCCNPIKSVFLPFKAMVRYCSVGRTITAEAAKAEGFTTCNRSSSSLCSAASCCNNRSASSSLLKETGLPIFVPCLLEPLLSC